VLQDPQYEALDRTLDVVELWSGVGNIYKAATDCKFNAMPFDKNRLPAETLISEDITGLCTSCVGVDIEFLPLSRASVPEPR
jgi:hypothetical protein